MNVLTAIAAEGERNMSTKIAETQENKPVVGQDPKPAEGQRWRTEAPCRARQG
jgi:hypothetical protein